MTLNLTLDLIIRHNIQYYKSIKLIDLHKKMSLLAHILIRSLKNIYFLYYPCWDSSKYAIFQYYKNCLLYYLLWLCVVNFLLIQNRTFPTYILLRFLFNSCWVFFFFFINSKSFESFAADMCCYEFFQLMFVFRSFLFEIIHLHWLNFWEL